MLTLTKTMKNCEPIHAVFIDEQHQSHELRAEFCSAEKAVWSPVSNRHCCWTFQPNPYGRRLWG